jgi:hypothetical protein
MRPLSTSMPAAAHGAGQASALAFAESLWGGPCRSLPWAAYNRHLAQSGATLPRCGASAALALMRCSVGRRRKGSPAPDPPAGRALGLSGSL